jgi:hypothetical protein
MRSDSRQTDFEGNVGKKLLVQFHLKSIRMFGAMASYADRRAPAAAWRKRKSAPTGSCFPAPRRKVTTLSALIP